MNKSNLFRTRIYKAKDSSTAHLSFFEAVHHVAKEPYLQKRINAKNVENYVRLRHRVICFPFLSF